MDKYGKTRKWFIKSATLDLLALDDNNVLSYAYIFHDKDTTTPHYHLCIELKNAKTRTALIKFLKLDDHSTSDEWTTDGALRYLIHADQPQKHQYAITDVKLKGMTLSRFEKTSYGTITTCEVYFLLHGRFNKPLEVFAEQSNVGKLINLIKASGYRPGCFNLREYATTLKRVSDVKNGVVKMNTESPIFAFYKTWQLIKQLPYQKQIDFISALENDADEYTQLHRGITLSRLDSDTYKK